MAQPATLNDALHLVRQSRLLDDGTLSRLVERTQSGDLQRFTPIAFFERLAGDGILTRFQARQLAAGRWRGLVLRNYKLLAQLGSGGMGRVFLGEHAVLGRQVAVKVLAQDAVDNPIAQARFIREARAAAGLDHPNIIRVFDIETDCRPPYLVMEYVDGVSLQGAVAYSGTFSAQAAVLVARQAADGLQHAWEHGLVHRDIKPANLLLDRRGHIRILDLGIVRADFDDGLTTDAEGHKQLLGTIDYLAPEQAVDSSAVDCRADVYGLGATLYFLLAGEPPFSEVPPPNRLIKKQNSDPEPIHQLRPDVSPELSAVIARMMARRPIDRFPTPASAAEALAPFAVPVAGFPDDVFESIERGCHCSEQAGAVTPGGGSAQRSSIHPISTESEPTQSLLILTPTKQDRFVTVPLETRNGYPLHAETVANPTPTTPAKQLRSSRLASLQSHTRRPEPRRQRARAGNLLLWLAVGFACSSFVLLGIVWFFVIRKG